MFINIATKSQQLKPSLMTSVTGSGVISETKSGHIVLYFETYRMLRTFISCWDVEREYESLAKAALLVRSRDA